MRFCLLLPRKVASCGASRQVRHISAAPAIRLLQTGQRLAK
jgi:hypothetical protein